MENPQKLNSEKSVKPNSEKLKKLIREFYGNPLDLPTMTDDAFIDLCERYGKLHLISRHKFIGLLPEAYRREIWKKKGFSNIFEFAARLAGLSEEQVRRALNLDESFVKKNLPCLREALVSGEVSINKLARVVSIATPENEKELLENTKVLPQAALETLVRDVKMESVRAHRESREITKTSNRGEEASADLSQLRLSPEILSKFLHLQRCGHNLDQLIGELLDQREQKIEEEKRAIVEEQEQQAYEHEWVKDWRETNLIVWRFGWKQRQRRFFGSQRM